MKKFLKIIGVLILLVLVFILVVPLFMAKTYHLEKDITINAPREKVWSNVSTLHALHEWSPWPEADPAIQINYEGQDGTPGAVYKWKGNSDVGSGSQTITKVEPNDKLETHLAFHEPMEGQAEAFIKLADAAGGTKVTWGFDTRHEYPMNIMFLFMDGMMGKQYNTGLAKLKAISEKN